MSRGLSQSRLVATVLHAKLYTLIPSPRRAIGRLQFRTVRHRRNLATRWWAPVALMPSGDGFWAKQHRALYNQDYLPARKGTDCAVRTGEDTPGVQRSPLPSSTEAVAHQRPPDDKDGLSSGLPKLPAEGGEWCTQTCFRGNIAPTPIPHSAIQKPRQYVAGDAFHNGIAGSQSIGPLGRIGNSSALSQVSIRVR